MEFDQLQQLNQQLLLVVLQLQSNNDTSERIRLVAESLKLINLYNDVLTMNKFVLSQSLDPSVEELYDLERYNVILTDLKLRLRHAQLDSKKREDQHAKEQREVYLQNVYQDTPEVVNGTRPETINKSKQDLYLEKNKQLTSEFLKLRQSLEASVFQSDNILETFQQSTENLKEMNTSFDLMNDLLSRGRDFISSLNRLGGKQRTQVKYSLYFFCSCCLFVILRRSFGLMSKLYFLFSLPIRIVLLPFRFVLMVLKFFIGSKPNDASGSSEAVTQSTSSILATKALSSIISTTTALLESTESPEGYEELSRQLSSIINEETTTEIGRFVDEL